MHTKQPLEAGSVEGGGGTSSSGLWQKLELHSSKGGKKSASRGNFYWIKVDFLPRIWLKKESDDE